ncbi:MAG: GTP cyclohydrolase II [Bdellovibrionales bacterium]|nr:GTP cyclohydrolase II [Bdellovibrionales bacterium]
MKEIFMKVEIDEKIIMPTKYGRAEVFSFRGIDGEHVIFAFGNWSTLRAPPVRIHSECLTGDVFGSKRCDCGPQLDEAMRRFTQSAGLLIYLRQEGRGIGLLNKLRAYRLQDAGHDTYEANRLLGFDDDQRDFKVAADMLRALGINQVQLLSNNPRKTRGLEDNGVRVRHRLFTQTHACPDNQKYLAAKAELGGHDGLQSNLLNEAKNDTA